MIDGLLIGSVYGLAAMGLSLIWGVMDVINLTHGAVIALGMFAMYLLFTAFRLNAYLLFLPIIAMGLDLAPSCTGRRCTGSSAGHSCRACCPPLR